MNLLKIIQSKEKITLFTKKRVMNDDELHEYFDMDLQLFS